MRFDKKINIESDEVIYTLRVTNIDIVRANITNIDRLLFDDCEGSDKISDKILALETLVRRIEESYSTPDASGTR